MITKETYDWIEELLDPKITEISDADYGILVEDYFREDKTDWFEEIDGKQVWDDEKIKQFWKLIRKFCMPKGKINQLYDFKYFSFPRFEHSSLIDYGNDFWEKNTEKSFSYPVYFNHSKFLEYCNLSNIIFDDSVIFYGTTFKGVLSIDDSKFKNRVRFEHLNLKNLEIFKTEFYKKVEFYNCTCNEEFEIRDTVFHGWSSFKDSKFHQKATFGNTNFLGYPNQFNESTFLDDVQFFECKFQKEVQFMSTIFSKNTEFIRPEFHNKVFFNQSQFQGVTVFDRPIFKGKTDFSYCYFEDINFKEINTFWSYRDYNYTESPKLYFKDVFFNSKTFIKNTDLSKLELDNSDVTNITFSRCIWNDTENRLKLVNELPTKNIETENKLKLAKNQHLKKLETERLIKKLRDSENHYRQLKKNFDGAKNWELSGKAYISEMEIRKRRLWLEEKYYQWIIYKFYDVFGGYTQDFKKPIISIFWLIIIFSGMYYFIDYDIVKALQRGVKGALPYMEIDTKNPFEGYWLILRNIELVLGGTFLAFFVLALRKRFKQ